MMSSGVQFQLDAFLAYAQGDAVLWHDPEGSYANLVGALELPEDVSLVNESELSSLAAKFAAQAGEPDERVLVYRQRYRDIVASDWLCDLECYAEHFSVDETATDWLEALVPAEATPSVGAPAGVEGGAAGAEGGATGAGQAAASSPDAASAAVPGSAPTSVAVPGSASAPAATQLGEDWYTLDDFRAAAHEALPGADGLSDETLARRAGFRLAVDCAFRATWRTAADYYDALFAKSVVLRASLPRGMTQAQSFRAFLYQRAQACRIFDYDDEAWITRRGLAELGVALTDVERFAEDAATACLHAGERHLTVASLRRIAPNLSLFAYELSDDFYESVLGAQPRYLKSAMVCKVRVFAIPPASPRGRDFVAACIAREGPTYVGDLLDQLAGRYGINATRSQVLSLAKAAGLYVYQGIDRIYESYDQFVREVE